MNKPYVVIFILNNGALFRVMNNYTNFPTSYFTATIDTNGQIYAFEASGQRIVGVVSKIYEDTKTQRDNAISKAEELYKLCVDNGIIKPEPTQEEVLRKALDEIQQTRKENQAIMEMNAKLVELVESLKRDNEALQASEPKIEQPAPPALPSVNKQSNRGGK